MDIEQIRADFPALKQYTWFQNGGVSITPTPVAEAHIGLMQELLERGPMHIAFPEEEYPRRERTMERIAQFFGVERGELGIMRGVSEGYQTVLRGMDWTAGDQILMTEEEEAALLLPVLHLRELFGIEVVKAPLVDDLEGQVRAFTERLTDRTKLVAFSHVTTDTGFRLPCAEICAEVRARGGMTFVDMAHSAGLYPINLRALECDFAGLLSYKWMYSPYAAGLLYVRKERLDDIRVTYAGGRAEAWLDFREDRFELKPTAERFQYGPWSWPLVHAWAAAMDYLTEIGLDAIWERTVVLTTRLKNGLHQIPEVTLVTPESPDRSAALVTFEVKGWDGPDFRDALRERWNIVIKGIDHLRNGLRTSVPFFLLEEEMDLLLEKVDVLAKERT
ncbi:MAG: aminotransferase class V-fold PLP-dependent enzyme [bacterium]|nr:aminotransferase class V-fold PLP-dependent enzyme [bacterium]